MDVLLLSGDLILGAVIVGGLIGLGLALYQRSVESRKWYVCPSCGERLRVELMDASRCSSCGAPLQQTSKES